MHSDVHAKSTMKELIIGVFRRPRAARRAIEALREFGFLDNQLGLLSSDPLTVHEPRPAMGRRAPFEAEHLADLGLPAQEVKYYLREIDRGHSIIVVDPRERTLNAITVLERQSPFERAIFRLPPFVPPAVEADAAVAAAG
jgi:hypothetical protein